jgi:hypothetical protein
MQVPGKRHTILVDLDGTLADTRHRDHLIKKDAREQDWVAYSMESGNDKPIIGNIRLLDEFPIGWRIVILTGRHDQARRITLHWLYRNRVRYDDLIMRISGDVSDSVVFKLKAVKKLRQEGCDITLSIDDYEPNIDALEAIGIPGVLVAHNGHGKKKDDDFHRVIDDPIKKLLGR